MSDIAYLGFYPMLLVALGEFLRLHGRRDRASWIDAMVWTLGVTTVLWQPLLEPSFDAVQASLAAKLVATAYPVLDLALLLLILRLAVGRASRGPAGVLLVASLVLLTATDVGYAIRTLEGVYVAGEPLDLVYLLMYGLVGAAALHPAWQA